MKKNKLFQKISLQSNPIVSLHNSNNVENNSIKKKEEALADCGKNNIGANTDFRNRSNSVGQSYETFFNDDEIAKFSTLDKRKTFAISAITGNKKQKEGC